MVTFVNGNVGVSGPQVGAVYICVNRYLEANPTG
jgi:hypothetical protein